MSPSCLGPVVSFLPPGSGSECVRSMNGQRSTLDNLLRGATRTGCAIVVGDERFAVAALVCPATFPA
jgi:hypothetical protein